MKNAYDRTRAKQLVPLLKAIGREIADRLDAIHILEQRIASMKATVGREDMLNLKAELADNRRELRLARAELGTFGCVSDETQPQRVLIPGIDGKLENGFHWSFSEPTIRRIRTSEHGVAEEPTPEAA